MFWHGGAMTGATWETTPDGRPGWQSFFFSSTASTPISAMAVERGRSGWSPYPEIYDTAPIFRTQDEAWALFRFGDAEAYATDAASRKPYDGLLFPIDHLDDFGSQFVPRWTDHGKESMSAYLDVLRRVGPVRSRVAHKSIRPSNISHPVNSLGKVKSR